MALLEILKFPDPKLRRKCKAVESITPQMQKLAQDMLETMYKSRGIGLAAAQVDQLIRLVVIDTSKGDKREHSGATEDVSDDREDLDADEARDEFGSETELERAIEQPLILFNPVVVKKQGKTSYNEGCLSVPTYYEMVERALYVEVEALDIEGRKIYLKTDGLLSICIQHEIDHLDGKLFIDRLSPIKSARVKSKIKKFGYPDPSADDTDDDSKSNQHKEAKEVL